MEKSELACWSEILAYMSRLLWVPQAERTTVSYGKMVDKKRPYFFEILDHVEGPRKLLAKGIFRTKWKKAHEFTYPVIFYVRAKHTYPDSTYPLPKIVLRFAKMQGKRQSMDVLPPELKIEVNGSPVPLTAYATPIDVTDYVNFVNDGFNKAFISWKQLGPEMYTVTVLEGRQVTAGQLSMKLVEFFPVDYETFSSQLAKALRRSECEPEQQFVRVSLMCPISKKRMLGAVRSTCCKHLECFDILSYIQRNEDHPSWKCPICGQFAPVETLVLDNYFNYVLYSRMLKQSYGSTSIQIKADESWRPLWGSNEGLKEEEEDSETSKMWILPGLQV